LLSMVCDGTVRVGTDGDTVIRSHLRVDEILGSSMEGKLLSDKVPADERARLCTAFSTCRGDGHHRLPVVSLPTTLLRQDAPSVNADLFIVNHQPDAVSKCRSRLAADNTGFLLGLRLSPTSVLAPEESENAILANEDMRRGRRVSFDEDSISSNKSSTIEDAKGILKHRSAGSRSKCSDTGTRKRLPTLSQFDVPPNDGYLKESITSMLEELLAAFNFELVGCCRWHAHVHILSGWIQDMKTWRTCTATGPQRPRAGSAKIVQHSFTPTRTAHIAGYATRCR